MLIYGNWITQFQKDLSFENVRPSSQETIQVGFFSLLKRAASLIRFTQNSEINKSLKCCSVYEYDCLAEQNYKSMVGATFFILNFKRLCCLVCIHLRD